MEAPVLEASAPPSISDIVAEDRKAFEDWLAKPSFNPFAPRSLDMPPEALRYLAIPEKLLELSKDPHSVTVIPWGKSRGSLDLTVIDPLNEREHGRMLDGEIAMEDFTLEITLLTNPGRILHIDKFMDREELRRQGVATSFYTRLRGLARALGFRYLTGEDNSDNVTFFTQQLGRVSLRRVRPEFRPMFFRKKNDERLDLRTVDFLYPEDRMRFLEE